MRGPAETDAPDATRTLPIGLHILERERKFYYSLLVFLILVAMRIGGVISETVFENFGQVAFIAYMAGNAAEHFAKRPG